MVPFGQAPFLGLATGCGLRSPARAIGLARRVAAIRPVSRLFVWCRGQPANISGSGAGEQVRVQAGDEFGEVLADGDVPVHGLPGADLNVATGQGVVVGVIGGYEQGGYIPAVSYSAQFTSNVSALYATVVAGG